MTSETPVSGAGSLIRFVQGNVALLILLFTVSMFSTDLSSIGRWLVLCLPLLLIFPGISKGGRKSLQWLGFLVLFYFIQGVMQLFSNNTLQQVLGALTVLSCIMLFTAAIVKLRSDGRHKE